MIALTGDEIGRGHREQTDAGRFSIDTHGVGEGNGSPVVDTNKPPYLFTGRIEKVVVDLK